MMRTLMVLIAAGWLLAFPALADDNAKLFGSLPTMEGMSISPNGNRLAMLRRQGERAILVVRDLDNLSGQPVAVDVSGVKVRGVRWANDQYVLLWASMTTRHDRFVARKLEYGAVFSLDTKTGKMVQLLVRSKDLAPNETLGLVSGRRPGSDMVLMPAFRKISNTNRQYTLFRVNLDTGRGHVEATGSGRITDQFIVDGKGEVRARMDYDPRNKEFRVLAYRDRKWVEIYKLDADWIPFSIDGITPDGSALVLTGYMKKNTIGLYHMSLADGAITGPVLSRPDADIDVTLAPFAGGQVSAVGYASVWGTQYQFLDKSMQATWVKIISKMPGIPVKPVDWSDDGSVWIILIHDASSAGRYVLYNAKTDTLSGIAPTYDDIDGKHVGASFVINYKSTDGMPISAVLTTPPGYVKQHPMPMVVLPHGGPTAHDSRGWDWLAQYLANEGYLVLQPNYRGSDGFGNKFRQAGDGNWVGPVLDDINQGAQHMIDTGYADPDRICIAGASFGGYEALAAVTLKSGPYKCAVSIAGVSDWQESIKHNDEIYGAHNQATAFWERRLRDENGEMDLDGLSPAKHAQSATAPVLLIHGRDDTRVPITQSRRMSRALERAGKPVELVELNGEDHFLSSRETRIETLSVMGDFLRKYLHTPSQAQTVSGQSME